MLLSRAACPHCQRRIEIDRMKQVHWPNVQPSHHFLFQTLIIHDNIGQEQRFEGGQLLLYGNDQLINQTDIQHLNCYLDIH